MRDLVVVGIVLVGGLLALSRPWIGVMLWNWISIMNPHRYAWGFAVSAPVAMVAALATLIGLLFTRERESPMKGAPVWWLLLFTAWMTLSWLMGYDTAGDYWAWDRSIKIFLMIFVALALLRSRNHILALVWVCAGSLAILGAKGGLFTVLTGGAHRVWGPAGTFIGDNNHFALALIMTVPLLHFLQLQLQQVWQRHAMSVVMLLCVAAALGSHSRGALLAMIAMGVVLWWRSRRKLLISMAVLMVVLILLPMMPEHWWDRMATIQTYQEDASAMGRINAWYVAWHTAMTHVFGAGMSYQHQIFFDLYAPYEREVRAAHSIYFQILGNHGFIGLAIYLALWISTFRVAGWLRRHGGRTPQTRWTVDLGAMVQVSLVGFAVGGAFLSMPYFDLPYNMMMMVVLARRWVEQEAWKTEKPESLLEMAGFRRRPGAPAAPGGEAERAPVGRPGVARSTSDGA
jgi:putative inorganic carbon (hco3(-)) transporter